MQLGILLGMRLDGSILDMGNKCIILKLLLLKYSLYIYVTTKAIAA